MSAGSESIIGAAVFSLCSAHLYCHSFLPEPNTGGSILLLSVKGVITSAKRRQALCTRAKGGVINSSLWTDSSACWQPGAPLPLCAQGSFSYCPSLVPTLVII